MSSTVEPTLSGTGKLDRVHNAFGFLVTDNGVSRFRGQFEQVEAALEDGVLVGTARVESVKTAIRQLTEQLVSPDFFSAAETPTVCMANPLPTAGDDEP
jgi:polyisoprenoid-binding protein YceI